MPLSCSGIDGSSSGGSTTTSSSLPCCPRPSQQEACRQRRRKVMLGGGLLVLCCCSLASMALAGTAAPPQQQQPRGRGPAPPSRSAAAAAAAAASTRPAFVRPAGIGDRSSSGSSSSRSLHPSGGGRRLRPSSALWVSTFTGATSATPPPPAGSPKGFVAFNHSSATVAIAETAPSMPLPPSQPAARPVPMPRPANLPGLSKEDLILLRAGQRVQHQIRNGCQGSGYVVVDVLADSKTVWDTLLDLERYAEMIPTIRRVRITGRPWKGLTKGLFTLSKFRFRLGVVHEHKADENRLDFFLDPDSMQYRSILEMAEGFWYIEDRPAGRPPGWTRVYMASTVKVNSLVPMWLVDYAAERALKRATAWLKPYVEQQAWEKRQR